HQGPSTKSIASRPPSSSRSSIITGGIGIAIGIALIPCNTVVSFTACGGSFGVAYPPDQGVDVSFLGFLLLPCLFFGLPLFPFDSLGLGLFPFSGLIGLAFGFPLLFQLNGFLVVGSQ